MRKSPFVKPEHTLRDIYKKYTKETPKENRLSMKQFMAINEEFSKRLVDKVLLDSEEVRVPILGTIRVKKFKLSLKNTKNLRVDFAETKKTGHKVYHLNEDRGGYIYRWAWRKNNLLNNSYYSFIPERYNLRRKLAKILKTDPTKDFFI